MDVPELMTSIATRLRLVPGLVEVYYPKPNTIAKSPCAVLIDGGGQGGPTVYRQDMRRHLVLPHITIRVLVKSLKQTPREESRLDELVPRIIGALDPVAAGGSVSAILPGLSGHVDRLWSEVQVFRGETDYAGEVCYAADIVIDPKFHSTAYQLEGTP